MVPRVRFTDGPEGNLKGICFEKPIVRVHTNGVIETGELKPGTREWVCRDTQVSGLHLRITRHTMTWSVVGRLGGKTVRRAIAHYQTIRDGRRAGGMKLADARKNAAAQLGLLARDIDPLREKRREAAEGESESLRRKLTLKRAYVDYCVSLAKKSKPGTNTDREKVIKWLERAPLWSKPIVDIDPKKVAQTFQPLLDACVNGMPLPAWGPKSVSAGTMNKLYVYTSAAYAYGARQLKLHVGDGESPFAMWRAEQVWPTPVSRETQLETGTSDGRQWLRGLVALQQRAHDPRVLTHRADPRSRELKPHVSVLADFFLCLLLWGSRKDETAKLRFSSVHFADGYLLFPGRTTKSGRDGMVPLTPWAIEILEQRQAANRVWRPDAKDDFVFPARQHGKPLNNPRSVLTTLQEETKSDDNPEGLWITAHVLRHTLATELYQDAFTEEELGKLLVIGAAMNHIRGRTGSVPSKATAGYIRKLASILRPHFIAREERLRAIAGLPSLTSSILPAGNEDDLAALAARAETDNVFRQQLLDRLFNAKRT